MAASWLLREHIVERHIIRHKPRSSCFLQHFFPVFLKALELSYEPRPDKGINEAKSSEVRVGVDEARPSKTRLDEATGLAWHGPDVYCIGDRLYDCNTRKQCNAMTKCASGCVLGLSECKPDKQHERAFKSRTRGQSYCDSTAEKPQKCPGGQMCSAEIVDCVTNGRFWESRSHGPHRPT